MAGYACSFSTVPERLVQLLTDELPYSLPLLRRLQFTKFNQGTTQHARIVFASDLGGLGDDAQRPNAFTAAYLDFSNSPDGLIYMYSTLERGQESQEGSEVASKGQHERQMASVVDEIIRLRREYCQEASFGDRLLLMSVHSDVRLILDKFRRVEARSTGYYDLWLFKVDELPRLDQTLPPGMYWDSASSLDDCRVTMSRTDIVRRAETLARLPSLMIKLEESKTPIAWAFLGQDGSLISVHCEEAYRRQGLAKKLAAKLIRENIAKFGNDGWCSAAVAAANHGSRGMCKALNGKPHWVVSWIFFLLSESESPTNLSSR